MENKKMRVLFVCNRGGHLSEILQLRTLFNKYDSMLLTEKSDVPLSLDIPVEQILAFRTIRKKKLLCLIYFFVNIVQSLVLWIKFRPKVIITTGANMAIIICIIGKLLGSRIIFIESGARIYSKSATGKLLEPFSDLIIVQWREMLESYNKSVCWGTIL